MTSAQKRLPSIAPATTSRTTCCLMASVEYAIARNHAALSKPRLQRRTRRTKHFVNAHRREYGDRHVHRRAGIAGLIDAVKHRETGEVSGGQDSCRHLRGPDFRRSQAPRRTGRTTTGHTPRTPAACAAKRVLSQCRSTTRSVGQQGCGLERDDQIHPGLRHDHRRIRRVPLHVKVADEKDKREKRSPKYGQEETGTESGRPVQSSTTAAGLASC